jgi:hypothetical protein
MITVFAGEDRNLSILSEIPLLLEKAVPGNLARIDREKSGISVFALKAGEPGE